MSVRVSINNYETLISNAEKRAVRIGEREIVPRLTDLPSVAASTIGKVELEYGGEDKGEGELVERLINRAVLKIWDKYLTVEGCERVTSHFEAGWGVEVSDRMRAEEYTGYRHVAGCRQCDLRSICDGFYGDYADLFGGSEARPVTVGSAVDDPQYYTRRQRKKLHPLDCEWLESH